MSNNRDDLNYTRINRLAAALTASVAIVLLIFAITAILQSAKANRLAERLADLEQSATSMGGLDARLTELERRIDAFEARPIEPPPADHGSRPAGKTEVQDAPPPPSPDRTEQTLRHPELEQLERGLRSAGPDSRRLFQDAGKKAEALVTPASSPDDLATVARIHQLIGDHESAVRWAESALTAGADRASTTLMLAQSLHELGDDASALERILPATESPTPDPDALLLRGRIELALGRIDEADATLSKAIAHDSVAVEAAALLAELLIEREDWGRASAVLDRGESLSGDDARLLMLRARSHSLRSEHEQAAAAATRVIQGTGANEEALALLGRSLLLAGKPSASVSALQQLVTLAPESAEAHDLLGQAYLALLQPMEAFAHFSRATELDGSSALSWYHLGVSLANGEDCEGAIVAFDAALELDPEFAQAHFGNAVCQANSGSLSAAEASLARALALDATLAEEAGRVESFQRFVKRVVSRLENAAGGG